MNRIIILMCILFLSQSCTLSRIQKSGIEKQKIQVNIDAWHKAAAEAKFDAYFNLMAEDAVFIGTDATENWNREQFMKFCKPYFDKGKAWNFTALERNIYMNHQNNQAWFDELLNTQMKICRGSGVMRKEHGQWKIVHYVLSMTIPNDHTKEVVGIKSNIENKMIDSLKLQPFNLLSR